MAWRLFQRDRRSLKPPGVSDNNWRYSDCWFREASAKELRQLLLTYPYGFMNYKNAEAELRRRASVRRGNVNRLVMWASFFAAVVAAVASVITLARGS